MKTIARFFVAKKRRRHKIIDKFARQKKYTHKNKYFGREREEKRELECMMLIGAFASQTTRRSKTGRDPTTRGGVNKNLSSLFFFFFVVHYHDDDDEQREQGN